MKIILLKLLNLLFTVRYQKPYMYWLWHWSKGTSTFDHKMTFPFGKVIQVVFIGIKTIFITFVGSSGKRWTSSEAAEANFRSWFSSIEIVTVRISFKTSKAQKHKYYFHASDPRDRVRGFLGFWSFPLVMDNSKLKAWWSLISGGRFGFTLIALSKSGLVTGK